MGLRITSAIKGFVRRTQPSRIIPVEHLVPDSNALEGQVALISGGTGGIGMAIAKELYSSGANVIVAGTNVNALASCAKDLGTKERVKQVVLDYTAQELINEAIEQAIECFGHIDVFVNSAGVHTENVNYWSMTPAEFERVMNINVNGAFFASRYVARHMIDAGIRGHIVFVNSSRGFEPAWSPYGLSKWSLRGLTQGMAQILIPYGITVNGIAPGPTATKLIGVSEGDNIDSSETAVGRLITPGEVASWVKMLVCSSGDMVVGETILVSGGRGGIDIR